tara:strand:+ start:923 stop:1063 length:141 start_codon:yes stop_codon:yes gene_type:complete
MSCKKEYTPASRAIYVPKNMDRLKGSQGRRKRRELERLENKLKEKA